MSRKISKEKMREFRRGSIDHYLSIYKHQMYYEGEGFNIRQAVRRLEVEIFRYELKAYA